MTSKARQRANQGEPEQKTNKKHEEKGEAESGKTGCLSVVPQCISQTEDLESSVK